MPIQIGQKTDHGYDEPLGLLSDCHRRIEKFLSVLLTVARAAQQGPLIEDQREALATALKYFREAAPKHTEDEEVSLFPRLRALPDAEIDRALAVLERLEAEHVCAGELHAEAEKLGSLLVVERVRDTAAIDRLVSVLEELAAIYATHIAAEDRELFPLAQRLLSSEDTRAIGEEMRCRRKA